jgi:electron transport complex protein RnfE
MSENVGTATEQPGMDAFLKGLWEENPVFVVLLGMCPTLAVTNSVINGVAMGLASTFVLIMSSMIISMVRKLIPNEIRIASFILIIATFVTVVDYLIQAISLDIYRALGAFIALIVVNCNILGRAEAYASKNPVGLSVADAAGVGLGFTIACFALGSVREVLGNGTFAGLRVFGPEFEPWTIMALPGGAFFVLASWLLLFNWMRERKAVRA